MLTVEYSYALKPSGLLPRHYGLRSLVPSLQSNKVARAIVQDINLHAKMQQLQEDIDYIGSEKSRQIDNFFASNRELATTSSLDIGAVFDRLI